MECANQILMMAMAMNCTILSKMETECGSEMISGPESTEGIELQLNVSSSVTPTQPFYFSAVHLRTHDSNITKVQS